MKKLILIPILFLSYILNAQYVVVKPSQLPPATTINVSDIFIINQGVTTKKLPYSALNTVLKDTFVTRNELGDTARAIREDFPTGSTVYASDGVYKDGDTVKYSGVVVDKGIEIRSQSSTHGNETGLSAYVQSNGHAETKIYAKGKIEETNDVWLTIDTSGIFYTYSPDTTLTTPTHLMTEAQVKREIAAAQRWTDISGGISYGNEVTVGSLAGTGNRNIGADSNGKLIDLAAAPGVLQSTTVNLTASQIFNKDWVSAISAQASGKMTIVQYISVFYNYGATTYTANEFFMGISYDAGSTTHQLTSSENVSTFLNTSSDGVVLVKVNPAILIPTNAAVYIRNSTSMTAPTGDGTFSVTIYYTIIDI